MLGAAAAVTAACTEPGRKTPSGAAGSPSPSPSGAPPATGQIATPADAAASVSTATDIAVTVANATRTDVELLDAAGTRIEGHLQPDGTTWRPALQLSYNTQYTVKLTVAGGDGKDVTTTTTFTTMKKPANLAKVSSVIQDKQTVGVAMPLIVNFGVDVTKDQRAAVQRRLLVTSNPPQEGVWHWFNGKEVHFRPKEYWQPGTTLSLRAAVGGLSFGGKWVGERDVTVQATVGRKLLMEVDNKTKQLTVTQDGQVVRTCPVSLGKPSSPTASGHFIIMIKNEWEWFDSSTFGVPSDSDAGYRMKVYWPQRLTWDGEYFHSAPWSVQHQGKRNVSHGCTNLSEANAKWLWQQTLIGDPVIIRDTEEHVKWGNGWTDWDISWEQYVKGSAIQ
ncbi:L,D-transpeptidase [Dactylosporangium fulvum]|uniref:Ig-like domain-containing protein n=1 Tax=Dactylosporangium fulvum TaxID=53359 RepID=A0ABY5WBV5_9ACTN|nr:Ig-like domain-containing protein [Dactylosporangium fulvum]UWP87547.1 Ig-like domain-containing protein [Dactylosporangium fulvum]